MHSDKIHNIVKLDIYILAIKPNRCCIFKQFTDFTTIRGAIQTHTRQNQTHSWHCHTSDIQYSQYRASAQAQRLQWVHHHQPGLSTHTRQNQTHSWHCHTSDNRHSPYRAFSPGQANLPVYNESININQDTSPWGFTQVTSFPQRPELDINQDTSPWGFTQVTSFHQRQVFGHQPGQSPWGFLLKSWVFLRNQKLDISQDNHTEVFAQVTSFPQRPDFGHQPSRDRDKLYSISMRQVSNIWKSFNATLSDSNPSHAPQSRVSVKETDFVNGRNMLNWTV